MTDPVDDYPELDPVKKRVRFFDGQFLTHEDLVTEQNYHVNRARGLAKALKVIGVTDGLAVSAVEGQPQLMIAAGCAIDRQGRQLLVPADVTLDVDADAFGGQEVRLYLAYGRWPSDKVESNKPDDYARWDETPLLVLVAADDGFRASRADGSATPEPGWPGGPDSVRLATLDVAANGTIAIADRAEMASIFRGHYEHGVLVNDMIKVQQMQIEEFSIGSAGSTFSLKVDGRLQLDPVKFEADPPEVVPGLRLGRDGQLGIGRDSAGSRLHVGGDLATDGTVTVGGQESTAALAVWGPTTLKGPVELDGNLTVTDRVGIGTTDLRHALEVSAGDTVLGGNLTVTGTAEISNGLHVTSSAGSSSLTVSASANHLQLRRESTESTAGSQVFLQLVQSAGTGAGLPQGQNVHPSILFGHENKFFRRIEAQESGFHFKEGDPDLDTYTGLHVLGIDAKGPVELESHVRIGAGTNDAQKLHVIGGHTYLEGDLFVKGQLAFWWEPDNKWKKFQNASGSSGSRTWAETSDARQLSDARLKTIAGPVRDAIATLSGLNGVRYHWSAAGTDFLTRGITTSLSAGPDSSEAEVEELTRAERRKAREALSGPCIGLIAQEVESVLPEVISEDAEGYKYINYGHLVAVLIEAIKEQQISIDRLGARLNRPESTHE